MERMRKVKTEGILMIVTRTLHKYDMSLCRRCGIGLTSDDYEALYRPSVRITPGQCQYLEDLWKSYIMSKIVCRFQTNWVINVLKNDFPFTRIHLFLSCIRM